MKTSLEKVLKFWDKQMTDEKNPKFFQTWKTTQQKTMKIQLYSKYQMNITSRDIMLLPTRKLPPALSLPWEKEAANL